MILLFLLPCFVIGQELEVKLLDWMERHGREKLVEKLDNIKEAYPKSPVPLYLYGYVEQDARRAIVFYKKIIQRYPDSNYAARSLLKLAQYYYMDESFELARQNVDDLKDSFPKSQLIPEARYLAAMCLVATSNHKKAETELKWLIKKYPRSRFKSPASQELKRLIDRTKQDENVSRMIIPQNQSPKTNQSITTTGQYTVQVGAYRNKLNALKQKQFYINEGYSASVISKYSQDGSLYCVCIENFETKKQARNFGDILKNRFGGSFQVVKND